ncbi:ABC transporter ATP-binding protein [Corynebacterium sp. S7]
MSTHSIQALDIAVRTKDLRKTYGEGNTSVHALDGITVEFIEGEFTAIMGPSGSGKSTLMHCMAGLDTPTSGETYLKGTDLSQLDDKAMTSLRRDRVGFIFQSFNLVPTLTAEENITLPDRIAGRQPDMDWLREVTKRFSIQDRLNHRPAELSGGQQQRVACARAIVAKPDVIFADEPTGNLDSNSSAEVLSLLRSSVDSLGQTVVIVTHDAKAASYADRVIFLADGQLVDELRAPTAEKILAVMARFD